MSAPEKALIQPESRSKTQAPAACAPLGVWDALGIVVGIVVGVGVFRAPQGVFKEAGGPIAALTAWAIGGALSLAGALCFAELASVCPRSGGEYAYLTKAFGKSAGFLFAWAQLTVIRSGGAIASVAFVFAEYAASLAGLERVNTVRIAAAAILLLTGVNLLGVHPGRRTQNLLTALKVAALAGVILAGFLGPWAAPTQTTAPSEGSFALALVFVLYTYSGWHEAAYVTAEVRDRRRSVPLALLAGTGVVTVLYLFINAAYLAGLGFDTAAQTTTPAAELLLRALGPSGGRLMGLVVMVSALGSLNGSLFTGARIYRELGADNPLFAVLARQNSSTGTPSIALILQGAVSMGLVVAFGLGSRGQDPFDALVTWTAPVFWLFFLLAGATLFVFRLQAASVRPGFSVPGYPVVPLVFCGWCAYMLYGSVAYTGPYALVGLGVLALGVPVYLASRLLRPGAL
jgi:amino acid transporter